jgi:ABC-type nickel/cobalt efflux system permease component RcnA
MPEGVLGMTADAFLALGVLAGMQHSLEADHLAAVAALVARERTRGAALRHGVAWGIGHAAALLGFCGVVLGVGAAISEATAQNLEALVGVMLVVLGADLLRRLIRERGHCHAHWHAGGARQHAAHPHAGEGGPHAPARYALGRGDLPLRTIGVGMTHGLAGSATLVVIALGADGSKLAFAYVFLFGVGSIVGMGLLSVAISLPLRLSVGRFGRLRGCMQAIVALATIGLGVTVIDANTDELIIRTALKAIGA